MAPREVTAWNLPVYVDDDPDEMAACLVGGYPAVAFRDNTGDLYFIRATDARGTAWGTTYLVDGNDPTGFYLSMAVIDGRPAISYQRGGDLYYVRASNANGTAWNTPVTADATGTTGLYTSLAEVTNLPAIAYHNDTDGDLFYILGRDADGSIWNARVQLDATGDTGTHNSLAVIDGFPAVAYHDVTDNLLNYVEASTANGLGAAWNTISPIISGGTEPSLIDHQDQPTIAYRDDTNDNLVYVQGAGAFPAWSIPSVIDSTGDTGHDPSLAIVNGCPAVGYYDDTNDDLRYVRATDADARSWATLQTLDFTNAVGATPYLMIAALGYPGIAYLDLTNDEIKYIGATEESGETGTEMEIGTDAGAACMTFIGGNPAVSFVDDSFNLIYVRATNAAGTAWGSPVTVEDAVNSITYYATSLAEVDGRPAISFAYMGDLMYIRASDATGSSWPASPDLLINGTSIGYSSMTIVSGNPGIAFYDANDGEPRFMRASNSTGSSWGGDVSIDSTNDVYENISMRIVNGNPAVAFGKYSDLVFVRASNSTGSSWGSPVLAASPATDVAMEIVNGNPAIAYNRGTIHLFYVRATDASGTGWGTHHLLDARGFIANENSMKVIAGSPAVTYADYLGYDVRHIRANNSNGSSWNPSSKISETGVNTSSIVPYTCMLELADGDFGACFADWDDADLRFLNSRP